LRRRSGQACRRKIVRKIVEWFDELTTNGKLRARDAEGVGIERALLRLVADRKTICQHAARVARVDDAVVPEPRGRVQRSRCGVELFDDRALHFTERFAVDRLAGAPALLFADDR